MFRTRSVLNLQLISELIVKNIWFLCMLMQLSRHRVLMWRWVSSKSVLYPAVLKEPSEHPMPVCSGDRASPVFFASCSFPSCVSHTLLINFDIDYSKAVLVLLQNSHPELFVTCCFMKMTSSSHKHTHVHTCWNFYWDSVKYISQFEESCYI